MVVTGGYQRVLYNELSDVLRGFLEVVEPEFDFHVMSPCVVHCDQIQPIAIWVRINLSYRDLRD